MPQACIVISNGVPGRNRTCAHGFGGQWDSSRIPRVPVALGNTYGYTYFTSF